MTDSRPSFDATFLAMAAELAKRGDCTRRQVAALVVLHGHIVGHGYNGAASGAPGCLSAGACPRGRHGKKHPLRADGYFDSCLCGHTWPCPDAVAPLSSYDTGPGRCIAVHAEINAILDADKRDRAGATIYVTCKPCDPCTNVIERVRIIRVVTPEGSYSTAAADMPVGW